MDTKHSNPAQDDHAKWKEAVLAELGALEPKSQHQASTKFAELYDMVEAKLSSNVSKKAVMQTLAKHGLKLHPSRFKELLEAERERRKAAQQSSHMTSMKEAQ